MGRGEQGESLNNDDVNMKTILKIMMRITDALTDQRGNQIKVDPKVNGPVISARLIC